jgi:hypothetical protein
MEYLAIETRVLRSNIGDGHVKATAAGVTPVYVKIDDPKNAKKLHQLAAEKIAILVLRCDHSDVVAKNVFASSEAGYAVWVAFNRRG